MWDLCYSLHSSVPFLPLCWAPLLPYYSHLKQPVDLTIPMGLLYALQHIPEQLFPHLSGPENQHLRCFLNILIPTSSPVDLGQSPRNCMLLNMQYPQVILMTRQIWGILCIRRWHRMECGAVMELDLQRRKITAKHERMRCQWRGTCSKGWFPDLTQRVSNSVGLQWDLGICIFHSDADSSLPYPEKHQNEGL